MEILAHPTLLAVAAALLIGLGASFALGLWRRGRTEAQAGIRALCGVKWRDYAHLIEDLLQERGFTRSTDERRPGEGGFDLMMTRGSSLYLIECKNGAAHRVTEQSIRDLAKVVEMQDAEGAVLATTGRVEPAALQLAANRRIEVLSGPDLWRQVKPWVAHDLRDEAEAQARGGFSKRLLLTGLIALTSGLLVAVLVPSPEGDEAREVAAVAPAATPPVAIQPPPTELAAEPSVPSSPDVSSAPDVSDQPGVPSNPSVSSAPDVSSAPSVPNAPMTMPDASMTEDQREARRASAVLEVRGNPVVKNANWSTKSTLVVSLEQPGAEVPDALFDEFCRILVQYEEMRYSRLQVETPVVEPDAAPTVRWRQCR